MAKACPNCKSHSWIICPKCGGYACRSCRLNRDGKNIVLFDVNDEEHQNYKIMNSKVYTISNYNISYQQIAPFVDSEE